MKNIWSKIPSIFYIPLMVGGMLLLMGGSIAFFWAMATIEGFVSVIMLIIVFAAARASAKGARYRTNKAGAIGTAAIITFFALMGMAIDQTGNYFYNKPAEILWCDDGSKLSREAVVSNPVPGRTDINQSYSCYDEEGEFVNAIGITNILAMRFIEYVFLAYFAIYSMKAYYMLRTPGTKPTPTTKKVEPLIVTT